MTWFVDMLSGTSTVTQIIVSLAVMLVCGFLMTRLTKLIKLPNVTGYILAGIIIGPYCLNLVPSDIVGKMDFVSDIALAFISFSVGEFFKIETLKKSGWKIIIITLCESLIASLVVFFVMFFVLKLSFVFCLVLSALASATAPASTIMTIRQTKSKGDFVDTLLQVIAVDNVISLLAYSITISIAVSSIGSSNLNFGVIAMPILKNLACIAIGAVLGFALAGLMKIKYGSDNRLIIVVSVLFLFCAIASLFDVSPLLGCMVIGMVYINVAKDEKLFLQVNYFSPPILLLFFVSSGLKLNLSSLFTSTSSLFVIPLWVIAIVYFFTRFLGKYGGAYIGCLATKKKKEVKNYLGLALIPQAGVAIGLAVMGARMIGGDIGNALQTIILASSILYELVGPVCAKVALYFSKSYSTKLEEITQNVSEKLPTGKPKSAVELLIDRIQEISKRNEKEMTQEQIEESAFTEASKEANEEIEQFIDNFRTRNKKRRY